MPFSPYPGLANRHVQTLWPGLLRFKPRPHFRRERIYTPDDDFLDIDWLNEDGEPWIILLHGLEGSSQSHYMRGVAATLAAHGFGVAVMHFRGCSGEPNLCARAYHSGETGDFAFVRNVLRARDNKRRIGAAGFSLGGNVLLRWSAGQPSSSLFAAVAVSVPYRLAQAADKLDNGFSRFYQWWLLRSLKRNTTRKFQRMPCPIALPNMRTLKNFRAFDDAVTARLHGFADAEDYYQSCSSADVLHQIRIPTLLIHAEDDPFTGPSSTPPLSALPDCITLELSRHGGHNGFIAGTWQQWPYYWMEQRVLHFFTMRRQQTCAD